MQTHIETAEYMKPNEVMVMSKTEAVLIRNGHIFMMPIETIKRHIRKRKAMQREESDANEHPNL